jgi:hypothetical protein
VDGAGGAAVTYAALTVLDADGRSLPAGMAAASGRLHVAVDGRGARYPLTVDPLAQAAYVKASNAGIGDQFGYAVSASGNTVVVGAPNEASSVTGVNGGPDDDFVDGAGAAYVFVREGATWTQQAYLKPSTTDWGDNFGWSVAISGDVIVVGAPYEDSSATGIGGDELDNSAQSAGAAYIFTRTGTTWTQSAFVKGSNTEAYDELGGSVAASGDTIVVGARFESGGASGVNGDESDDSSPGAGAAYVFVRSHSTWSQQAYVKASNPEAQDFFGSSVAVSGNTLVVGADAEDGGTAGIDGNPLDNSAPQSGAAYVFVRSGTAWSQQAYVKASNPGAQDFFGFPVAISGDTIAVGASGEASAATGVNGNELDNSAPRSGAVYVYMRTGTTWSQQAYVKASNTEANDFFGSALALSGDTLVAGAFGESSGATGLDGNAFDNSAH